VNLPVDVDAAPYTSACSSFYAANHAIIDAVSTLNGTLDGCGAMAGSDTGGQAWADQYDGAARPLLQAGADLGESMAQMAKLLNGSLINHKGAEYGAVTGEPPQYETAASDGDANPDHWTETLSASPPPSANGGTGDNPDRWHWLVDHLEGYLWPDADTRKLRGAGAAWVRCSETLTVYATSVESAKGSILNERSPEIADAAAACTELKGHVTDLSAAYAAIGKADGVTTGEDGWSTQVAREGRRWDYANETEQKAVEVKSGTTPVREGLVQLDKDESALKDGWDVTWHLKKEPPPTLMRRLEELSKKYPDFHYDISG